MNTAFFSTLSGGITVMLAIWWNCDVLMAKGPQFYEKSRLSSDVAFC